MTLTAHGTGENVVLVHGEAADSRMWDAVSDGLRGEYRVITPDRRFHGKNPRPGKNAVDTYEGQAADLEDILRALDGPAHVVAHSYGAGVALLTTLHHPELVRTLTLIEPPFSGLVRNTDGGFVRELASRDSLVEAVVLLASRGKEEQATDLLVDWMQGRRDSARFFSLRTQSVFRANADAVGASSSSPAPRLTCEQLATLRTPVLVLRGDKTRLWYRRIAEATAECLPKAKSEVIPKSRHMVPLENPDATIQRIAAFLAKN